MNSYADKNSGSELSLYERWQIAFSVIQIFIAFIQAIILIITVYVAWKIGHVQNNINQQLLDLNFRPSIEVTSEREKLNIYNKGRDNVWLWGAQFNDEPKLIEPSGRLITPDSFYYLFSNKLNEMVNNSLGKNGDANYPFNLFISTTNGKKYTVNLLLYIRVIDGNISINTQTLGFVESDWTK